MAITAKLRHLRIAPRKVRLVADLIRGKNVQDAQTILNFTTKKGSGPLYKLLKSALANAKNNFQMEAANLYISKITVDEGPKLKRWMARARGQAYEIQKKTSHITIVLDEIIKRPKRLKKVKPAVAKEIKQEKPDEKIAKKEEGKKPKLRPASEIKKPKPERGIKRIFRRKAF